MLEMAELDIDGGILQLVSHMADALIELISSPATRCISALYKLPSKDNWLAQLQTPHIYL